MSNGLISTVQQLGTARLTLMGMIVVALLAFFVFLSMRITSGDMKMLYADLTTSDSAAVAAKLESVEIPYEVSADGSRIMVGSNDVGRARMLLAADGLPNGGSMGYEIFDKQSGYGTTNFVQNINQVRALEGELARTISSIENVRSARVHIVLPQRELFSRENRQSSASVFLSIRPGAVIERGEILSIQSLVSSAVPDLKPTNVSIIDSNGNLLQRGGEDEQENLSMKAEEMRRNIESRLTSKIEEQVSRIVGFGKVTAVVTADVNFDRISTNEELFDPEGQVLRSTQTTQDASSETEPSENQEVSVGTNIPGVGGDLLNDGGPTSTSSSNEEVNNYEISKTIRNTISDIGQVKKLSVSVLVDGRYTKDAEGKDVYEPRPQAELDQITALVRGALGMDETRGDTLEVVNMQFAQVDTTAEFEDDRYLFGFEKSELISAAEVIVVAIMVILVILLVLQPMVSRLLAVEGGPKGSEGTEGMEAALLSANPANPALTGPGGTAVASAGGGAGGSAQQEDDGEELMVDLQGIEGKVKASTLKKVEEIIDNYPKETVSVIRSWMTQES